MTPPLTEAGYIQTKGKLADLIDRRSRAAARTDLAPAHRMDVLRSYDRMIGQYRRETKLHEATHAPRPSRRLRSVDPPRGDQERH
jgi:hypothetical protein